MSSDDKSRSCQMFISKVSAELATITWIFWDKDCKMEFFLAQWLTPSTSSCKILQSANSHLVTHFWHTCSRSIAPCGIWKYETGVTVVSSNNITRRNALATQTCCHPLLIRLDDILLYFPAIKCLKNCLHSNYTSTFFTLVIEALYTKCNCSTL